jgi:hypothetical protein
MRSKNCRTHEGKDSALRRWVTTVGAFVLDFDGNVSEVVKPGTSDEQDLILQLAER